MSVDQDVSCCGQCGRDALSKAAHNSPIRKIKYFAALAICKIYYNDYFLLALGIICFFAAVYVSATEYIF